MSSLHQHHHPAVPRGALIMAAAIIAISILAALAVRTGIMPLQASPAIHRAENQVVAVTARDLRFSDRADGAVVIEDISNGQVARTIEPGKKTGFVRGIMRSMARERRIRGIGAEAPFRLTAWSDGELTLRDTVTGQSIELNAFGRDNRVEFAMLLPQNPKAM